MRRQLATLAPGGPVPLLANREALGDVEIVVCGVDEDADVTLDELDLPSAALRFALDDADLVRLAKPAFLRLLCDRSTADELLFVDPHTVVRALPRPAPLAEGGLRLWPRLPRSLAARKPSDEAAAEAGAGDPTGAVLQLRRDGAVPGLLDRWSRWMGRAHARGPHAELAAAELAFLRTLPPSTPTLTWDFSGSWAHWSDLHPDVAPPDLVDLDGVQGYVAGEGAALDVIARRTHAGASILELVDRLQAGPASRPPPPWCSGAPIAQHVRDILRAVDPWGARWPDPFDDTGDGGFRAWLEDADARGLPRAAQAIYWGREDLRASFPASTPVRVLASWMAEQGLTTTGVPAPAPRPSTPVRVARAASRRLRRVGRSGEPTLGSGRDSARAGAQGVNVVGFLRSESGLGEAARSTLAAVQGLGLPVGALDLSERAYSREQEHEAAGVAEGTPYDATVLHLNPEEVLGYLPDSLRYRMHGSWHVGMWFWESDRVPRSWLPAFDVVDELWAASSYLAGVFAEETGKPIHVVGLPVEVPCDLAADRPRFGIAEDELVVGYVTDAYSGQDRKNPLAAVEAFRRAFGPRHEGVRLLLKISNLEKFPGLARALRAATEGLPVTVVGEYLERRETWQLLACADVYLSLHASEGFGLTILEAMTLGVPPVATGHGGSMDFTDERTALLVDYELVPSRGGPAGVYGRGGRWAAPDVDHAAQHLRTLGEDSALRARLGEAARARAGDFTPQRYRERLRQRLVAAGLDV